MFWTRKWGYVTCREELAMLNRAERTRKRNEQKQNHLHVAGHKRRNAHDK